MLRMHNNSKYQQLLGHTTPYKSKSGINCCCFKCIKHLKSSPTRTFHKSYLFESPSHCRLSKGQDLETKKGENNTSTMQLLSIYYVLATVLKMLVLVFLLKPIWVGFSVFRIKSLLCLLNCKSTKEAMEIYSQRKQILIPL